MKIPSPRARRGARIEIIPLIDIMFFLLATFVMVSLSMVKNHGIAVHLPGAATGEAQDRRDYISISVLEDGSVYYGKEKVALEALPERLQALKASTADPKVFINGDEHSQFGRAIAVLDAVRKEGITKIAIETKALNRG